MKSDFSILILMVFCLFILSCNSETDSNAPAGLFENPPDSVSLFAEGLISKQHNERDMAISPKGDELYFTMVSPKNTISTIIRSIKADGHWSKPEIASFSGQFPDLEPAFSPDGNTLFFASKRPLRENGAKTDYDIWFVERSATGWSAPQNMGAPVNSDKDEFYPSVGQSGNLYFTAAYANAIGYEDIYLSRFENGKYLVPVPLDSNINSKTYEFNAWVAPDESRIIYSSYGRPDGFGGGDLYMSTKDSNGHWLPAKNLGENINSNGLDYCPFVDFGNQYLFFTSDRTAFQTSYKTPLTYDNWIKALEHPVNGTGNIYWVKFD